MAMAGASAGIVTWFFCASAEPLKADSKAKPTPEMPKSAMITITFSTEPYGAQVYVDGMPILGNKVTLYRHGVYQIAAEMRGFIKHPSPFTECAWPLPFTEFHEHLKLEPKPKPWQNE